MHVHIEILHPAHVHFFKYFIADMTGAGHRVTVTARDKDVAVELLERLGIEHRVLSSQQRGSLGLAGELLHRTARLTTVVRGERPDYLTGIMGPTIALAGRLTRTPVIVFYDTETSTRTNPWVYRLATRVCTPASYRGRVPPRAHLTYPGYHELAYLHPDRFIPDPSRLAAFGLGEDEPFAFVRFVSWEASHDLGDEGMTLAGKLALVRHLEDRVGRVVVSHEGDLPAELAQDRLRGPVEEIHHLLAGATIVVGDSGTMSSEAAVLGTPAIFVSPVRLGYLLDLESRYGLVVNLDPQDADAISTTVDRTLEGVAGGRFEAAVDRLRTDTIDVTSWMVELFENEAPASIRR